MEQVQMVAAIWILAYMLFKVNPQNDPNNPGSKMSPYHCANVRSRVRIEKIIEEEKVNARQKYNGEVGVNETLEKDTIILWPDIYPYLETTVVTLGIWAGYHFCKVML